MLFFNHPSQAQGLEHLIRWMSHQLNLILNFTSDTIWACIRDNHCVCWVDVVILILGNDLLYITLSWDIIEQVLRISIANYGFN